MKPCFIFGSLASLAFIFLVALMCFHFEQDGRHICKPCDHKKDWLTFYNMVNSKDSGCMILETGTVTFKPHLKK